jgi:hypothetical protein
MKETTDSEQKQLPGKGDDLVFPIMALLFAIYYFYTIMDLSWEAQINGFLIGSFLIILVLIFLVRTALEVIRGQSSLRSASLFKFNRIQMIKIGLLCLAVAYVLVIPWTGYTLTTFTFLIAAMLVLGVASPAKLIGVSLALSLTGYYFFIELLDTRFAPGPFENFIQWLF